MPSRMDARGTKVTCPSARTDRPGHGDRQRPPVDRLDCVECPDVLDRLDRLDCLRWRP